MNSPKSGASRGSLLLRSAIITALSASIAGPALAQDQEEGPYSLEEVTVTAQKREQSALEVPITISVFGAGDIEKTGALNLSEMQDFVPGFEVGESATQSNLRIRGVSSANISTGGDPSVATFYDDVYIPRAATSIAFSDMARIEILKGPQGTLYGRNALAGVVNMVPNRPSAESEGFARARLGNYSLWRVEAMGNVAVSDNFYIRGNILSNNRDGYVTNTEGGTDPGSQENLVARLAGLWEISDTTQLQLSWDYDKVDNAARGAIGVSPWAACPKDPFCGKVSNDVVGGDETRDMQAITGKLLHDFNDRFSSKFVASYREYDTTNRQDEDGTAENDRYLDTDNVEDSNIFYTELQFNYEGDNYFLTFGANYSREDIYQEIPVNSNAISAMRAVTSGIRADTGIPIDHIWDPNQMALLMSILTQQPISPEMVVGTGDFFYDTLDAFLPGIPVVGPSFNGNDWQEIYYNTGDFKNYGIYGDIDFNITDKLSAIIGLRYSWDDKTFTWRNPWNSMNELRPGTSDLIFKPVQGYEEARTGTLTANDDWSKLTGRAVLNYQINDETLTFLSYSTGYRSGAFDSLNPITSDDPLPPAESTNIEWGLKGGLFNGRLTTEFALFYLDIKNRNRTVDSKPPGQLQALPILITGDEEIKGWEIVLNWLITDTMQLGFLTTQRDQDADWQPFYDASGELVVQTSSDTTNTDYTFTYDWFPEISRGDLAFRLEYIFKENNDEFDPAIVNPDLPGFGEDRKLLNARVAWSTDDLRWTFGLWGKNLLDNEVTSDISNISLSSFQTPFVSIDPPRTYGVEATYQF